MIKSISISAKITLLILLLSVVAVTAISFFTYDYVKKTREEKFRTNLAVIADNRAGFVNAYLEKVVASLKSLQESDVLKSGGSSGQAPGAEPDLWMMDTGMADSTAESIEPA